MNILNLIKLNKKEKNIVHYIKN